MRMLAVRHPDRVRLRPLGTSLEIRGYFFAGMTELAPCRNRARFGVPIGAAFQKIAAGVAEVGELSRRTGACAVGPSTTVQDNRMLARYVGHDSTQRQERGRTLLAGQAGIERPRTHDPHTDHDHVFVYCECVEGVRRERTGRTEPDRAANQPAGCEGQLHDRRSASNAGTTSPV